MTLGTCFHCLDNYFQATIYSLRICKDFSVYGTDTVLVLVQSMTHTSTSFLQHLQYQLKLGAAEIPFKCQMVSTEYESL